MPNAVYTDAQAVLVAVLVKARKDAGMFQADLAARIGKDQSYISNIERGQRRVDLLEFYALARAMHIDPVSLYENLVRKLPDKISV